MTPAPPLKACAVVMAGGVGSRLGSLTENLPKPMLPVAGKPILDIVLSQLRREGFRDVTITTGYRSEMIRDYCKDGAAWGLSIRYTLETEPLGTVGALSLVTPPAGVPLLVMNGDILTNESLRGIVAFHEQQKAGITVGIVRHAQEVPFGVVTSDGELLTEIEEKPKIYIDIGAGVYVLSPEALSLIPPATRMDFPELVRRAKGKMRVVCHHFRGEWKDVGRPEDYRAVQQDRALLASFGLTAQAEGP